MSEKAARRSDCPISYALEILGDRWSLLVLRDLLLEDRRRFKEFLGAGEGIATNVLADRLRRLERRGLLRRVADPADGRQVLYYPTEIALGLVPMLVEMVAWGSRNDPRTAVDEAFLRQFEEDREGLVESIKQRVRAGMTRAC